MKPIYKKGQKRIARFNKKTGAFVDYIPVGNQVSQKVIDSPTNSYKTVHDKYRWYEFRHLRLFLTTNKNIKMMIAWVDKQSAIILVVQTAIIIILTMFMVFQAC